MLDMILDQSKYLAILFGLAAGFPLMWQRRERVGLRKGWQVLLLCILFTVVSVASALLFASFEKLISGNGLSFGAISTYGVYFFCPLILVPFARGRKDRIKNGADLFALYALPSLFFLRINCMISGCCGGTVIHGTNLRWPTRQAELVFYAVMLAALIYREKQGAASGQAFPLLMASYGCFRFVEEWFRISDGTSALHLAHLWSVLAAALGLAIYFELRRRSAAVPSSKKRRKAQ